MPIVELNEHIVPVDEGDSLHGEPFDEAQDKTPSNHNYFFSFVLICSYNSDVNIIEVNR